MADTGLVTLIKHRMRMLGIDLDQYINDPPTNTWDQGFGFTCKGNNCSSLMHAVVDNPNFGSDSAIGGSMHAGVSFREVNKPDSLHIILSNRVIDHESGATCEVHLDSVSPVSGRDPNTRKLTYDYGRVLQHLVSDKWNHPNVIVPSGEGGVVFGLRF